MLSMRRDRVNTARPRARPVRRGGPTSSPGRRSGVSTAATVSRWRRDLGRAHPSAAAGEGQRHRELVGEAGVHGALVVVQEPQQAPSGPLARGSRLGALARRGRRRPRVRARTPPHSSRKAPGEAAATSTTSQSASIRRSSQSSAWAASRCRWATSPLIRAAPDRPRTPRAAPGPRAGQGARAALQGATSALELALAARREARRLQLETRRPGRGRRPPPPSAAPGSRTRGSPGTWVPPVTSTRLAGAAVARAGITVCRTQRRGRRAVRSRTGTPPPTTAPGSKRRSGEPSKAPCTSAPQTSAAARTAARCWGRRPGPWRFGADPRPSRSPGR